MLKTIKRNILLNPGPATTTDTVKYAQVIPDICPREKEFCKLIKEVRNDLVKVVKGDESYTSILFGCSGTGGVEAILSSVLPQDGKLLIISNGAYGKRMQKIASRYYPDQFISYDVSSSTYPDIEEIERIIENDKDLTHIAVIHHETTSGMLNPIKKITEISHKNNIEVIVDAMSSYAGIYIDIKEEKYDYLVSSSNKCIQGMAGISFVITKKNLLEKIKNYPKRNLYLSLFDQYEAFEKNGQMQFTPPVQIIYALKQALVEFFEESIEGRVARYSESWETLIKGLESLGFKLLLPLEQHSKILTTVYDIDNPAFDFNEMHDYLYERGFTIYPGKIGELNTFRISNIGDINKDDINDFLDELKNYLVMKNII